MVLWFSWYLQSQCRQTQAEGREVSGMAREELFVAHTQADAKDAPERQRGETHVTVLFGTCALTAAAAATKRRARIPRSCVRLCRTQCARNVVEVRTRRRKKNHRKKKIAARRAGAPAASPRPSMRRCRAAALCVALLMSDVACSLASSEEADADPSSARAAVVSSSFLPRACAASDGGLAADALSDGAGGWSSILGCRGPLGSANATATPRALPLDGAPLAARSAAWWRGLVMDAAAAVWQRTG